MKSDRATLYFRSTELTRTAVPALVEHMAAFVPDPTELAPRSYPGYPRIALPVARSRRLCPLDATLRARRSEPVLGEQLPDRAALGRILQLGHGYTQGSTVAAKGRGTVPSAGGLQALELYLVRLVGSADAACRPRPAEPGWLPPGLYHYDRTGHHLSQVAPSPVERRVWEELVPSLRLLAGGALLWLVVGNLDRVARKYSGRAYRFLLLEAGHLMQNLCLLSTSVGLCTVPLGACLERAVGAALVLPRTDAVLYAGGLGVVARGKDQLK